MGRRAHQAIGGRREWTRRRTRDDHRSWAGDRLRDWCDRAEPGPARGAWRHDAIGATEGLSRPRGRQARMTRFRLTVEFDGRPFMGLQRPAHGPSVQQAGTEEHKYELHARMT